MDKIKFEFDIKKSLINLSKHGISFAEACTVFDDERAIVFDDPDHSDREERFLILGLSSFGNLLIVCHCLRDEGNVIRIISARKATKTERKQYDNFNRGW